MPTKRPKQSVADFATNPPAAPAPVAPKKAAAKKPTAADPVAIPEKAMRALTVRLDLDLWAKLRHYLINDRDRRSANQYIVDLIIADLDPKTKKR